MRASPFIAALVLAAAPPLAAQDPACGAFTGRGEPNSLDAEIE